MDEYTINLLKEIQLDTINLLKEIQLEMDTLVKSTHPSIQCAPNMTVHRHRKLKKIQVDLKKLDTKLFMNSKFLEGLL